MNQEQTVEFGMAAAPPWAGNNLRSPRICCSTPPRRDPADGTLGPGVSRRWIVNREADVNAIIEKAACFRDLAQGPIDPRQSRCPVAAGPAGIPTPPKSTPSRRAGKAKTPPR